MLDIVPFGKHASAGVALASPEVIAAFRRWLAARFSWNDDHFIRFAECYVLTGSLEDPPTEFRETKNTIKKQGHVEGAEFFWATSAAPSATTAAGSTTSAIIPRCGCRPASLSAGHAWGPGKSR